MVVPVPSVPRRKSGNDAKLHIFLPGAWLDEAEELAEQMSGGGVAFARADAIRLALRRGLDELRREQKKRQR